MPLKRITNVEIVRYNDAPWAPRVPGATWAYRITTPSGNVITGARRDTEENVKRRAAACAARLARCYARYRVGKNGYLTEAKDVA